MPYPGEHAARIKSPSEFKENSFRRINISDGIDTIQGKLKDETTMTVQTYRFNAINRSDKSEPFHKKKFTVEQAKKWLKEHSISYISFEPASNEENAMTKPILLYTPIFSDIAESITNQILDYKQGEEISFWLNSPGGSVNAGYTILNALKENGNDFNTTILGDADSMAFIMLLFSKKNKAYDTANFLVHRAASWWEDVMNEDELKDIENRNKVIREKLEARIDKDKFKEVTGKTFDDIFSMDDRLDVRLDAKQAKEIGLIDEIITLDVAKRQEIESRYLNEIAALSINNSNVNKKKMGKLTDLIFGEKDPVLIAQIGETQFAYSKLEEGAKIKAVGKGEHEPISGTFEADDKKITVVDNEITAVAEFDKKQKEIDALKSELKAVKDGQITAEDVKEVIAELQKQHSKEMSEIKAILDKAKISVSKPELPEGEFVDDKVIDNTLTMEEKLLIEQKAIQEKRIKEREG